jgi:hypothetical protein
MRESKHPAMKSPSLRQRTILETTGKSAALGGEVKVPSISALAKGDNSLFN